MDDDRDDDALTKAELREIAANCEGTLRCLHKELRRRGLTQASYAALEAADGALSAARALAAEMPPAWRGRHSSITPGLRAAR
jgi:hypothetical protein